MIDFEKSGLGEKSYVRAADNRLKKMVPVGEYVLWESKPDKKTMLFESIFNFFLPFVIVWLLFDSVFFVAAFTGEFKEGTVAVIPFLLLHMTPVWIYLGRVFTTGKRCANTSYIITDKKIYASGGIFYNQDSIPLVDIVNVTFNQGVFDRIYGVGDVRVYGSLVEGYSKNGSPIHQSIVISNVRDFESVYHKICQLIDDVQKESKK